VFERVSASLDRGACAFRLAFRAHPILRFAHQFAELGDQCLCMRALGVEPVDPFQPIDHRVCLVHVIHGTPRRVSAGCPK